MKETLDALEQVIIHHFKRYSFTSRAWQQLPTRDRIEFLKDMRRDMEKVLNYKEKPKPSGESKPAKIEAPAKPTASEKKTVSGGRPANTTGNQKEKDSNG